MLDLWKISSRFFFIDFLNLKFYMAHPVYEKANLTRVTKKELSGLKYRIDENFKNNNSSLRILELWILRKFTILYSLKRKAEKSPIFI